MLQRLPVDHEPLDEFLEAFCNQTVTDQMRKRLDRNTDCMKKRRVARVWRFNAKPCTPDSGFVTD